MGSNSMQKSQAGSYGARQGFEDVTLLLALETVEGATSQGMQALLEAEKDEGTDSP